MSPGALVSKVAIFATLEAHDVLQVFGRSVGIPLGPVAVIPVMIRVVVWAVARVAEMTQFALK